jgi:hypothetical protein
MGQKRMNTLYTGTANQIFFMWSIQFPTTIGVSMSRRFYIQRAAPDVEMEAMGKRIQEGEEDYYRCRAIYYDLCAGILYDEMVSYDNMTIK